MKNGRRLRRLAVIASMIACCGQACVRYQISLPASLEAAKRGYREHRDLASLQALMGALRLGMPKQAVVALLGEPDYCPIPDGQCYYASDKRDGRDYTITLVVEYRHYIAADQIDMVTSGRLEQYSLFPVGE